MAGTRRYGKVAVGGTFDQFHSGHMNLLDKALEVGERVLIGLTTEKMLHCSPKNHPVDSYAHRRRELLKYVSGLGALQRVKVIPLNDPYGPTVKDEYIEALVVSRETEARGEEVNRLRIEHGLKPLSLIVIDMVMAEDKAPITTTRIRHLEIDREGRLLETETRRVNGTRG